jgi:F0F1-type ATP synthase assembly protein I
VTELPDDRSALARAASLASSVTSISLEMVLPVLGGYWLDQRCGTKAVFALLGAAAGLALGIWSLLRLTETTAKQDRKQQSPSDKTHKRT